MYLVDDFIECALQELTLFPYETDESKIQSATPEQVDKYFRGCGYVGVAGNWEKTGWRGNHGVEWCGVFVAYCLRNVGAKVKWDGNLVNLPNGGDILYVPGNSRITRGDIAVREPGHHHFIVLDKVLPAAETAQIKCVEGNAGGSAYPPQLAVGRRKNTQDNCLKKITHYYRVY